MTMVTERPAAQPTIGAGLVANGEKDRRVMRRFCALDVVVPLSLTGFTVLLAALGTLGSLVGRAWIELAVFAPTFLLLTTLHIMLTIRIVRRVNRSEEH